MMRTTARGKEAEAAVASHLKSLGWKVVELNWRTKVCEIDIIAKKDKVVYIVEVKYRTSSNQGTGLDYITPAKLKRLKFAAGVWAAHSDWSGDMRLMGAGVNAGPSDYEVNELVELG